MNVTLHYASGEKFFATDAAMMADHARVFCNGKDLRVGPGLELLGKGWNETAYLDWQSRDYAADAAGLMSQYGHVGYLHKKDGWTQLWLFMLYNDKAFLGFGLHEGDWEMVQWHEDGRCAFGQHNYGMRAHRDPEREWVHHGFPEWNGQDVYVARGSHALYPKAGGFRAPVVPDIADGAYKAPPSVAVQVAKLELRDLGPWASWPGRWGSTKARNEFEGNSPDSPLRQRRGKDPEWFWRSAEDLKKKALG